MYPINSLCVQALVCFMAQQVVGRFFATLREYSEDKTRLYSAEVEWFSNRITEQIWRNWKDVTTCHQAEHKIEEIYNAARTELVQLLGLAGGTVEFGPGDVQPLTDQRLGQSEAWDLWTAWLWDDNYFQAGWYINGDFVADDLDDFLDEYDQMRYVSKHDATIEYHRADHHYSWTFTSFNHDRLNDLLGTRI